MTRREVIVGGAALLGGFAIGKPTRGVLGANDRAQTANSIPSAREYVQNGLIGLWDGIENAGWGINNPNAAKWLDLIGNANSTLGNGYWTDNARVKTSGSWCIEIPGRWSAMWEIVIKLPSGSDGNLRFIKIGRYGCALVDGDARGITVTEGSWKVRVYEAFPIEKAAVFTQMNHTIYVNGLACTVSPDSPASFSGETDSQRIATPNGAEVYCVRRYNRLLSQMEISHNYAVDKARFGL